MNIDAYQPVLKKAKATKNHSNTRKIDNNSTMMFFPKQLEFKVSDRRMDYQNDPLLKLSKLKLKKPKRRSGSRPRNMIVSQDEEQGYNRPRLN